MQSAAQMIAPDVLRLRAGNPSPLTGTGTNSYMIFGPSGAVLVDAGPDLPSHITAILAALKGAKLDAILITHPHLDHSGATAALVAQTGAQVYSFGPAPRLPGDGSEGTDFSHMPDILVQEGAFVAGKLPFTALHTPGHMQGHLCFGYRDLLFSGDHVMGWSSTLVAPPSGDMAAYRASLRALQGLDYARYLPGHGDTIENPAAKLAELIAHRELREAQIIAALKTGAADAQTLAQAIYTDLPVALLPAAALNLLAHLIELAQNGQVHNVGAQTVTTRFALC